MHATTRMNLKPLGLVAIIVAIGLVSTATSLADHKGKPHGKPVGDPPPPAPVSYELIYLSVDTGFAFEINNSGVVVGGTNHISGINHAFRVVPDAILGYDPDVNGISQLYEDLNNLGGIWVNEEGVPLGDEDEDGDWIASSAKGINGHDEIVGTAINSSSDDRRVYRFVPSFDPSIVPPQLMLLPEVGSGEHIGHAINDAGDIVGHRADSNVGPSSAILYSWDANLQEYVGWDLDVPVSSPINARLADINNRVLGVVQIVTTGGFLVTLSPDQLINEQGVVVKVDVGSSYSIWRINDSGAFTGTRHGGGRGRNKVSDAAFRWTGFLNNEGPEILNEASLSFGSDINSDGDVSIWPDRLFTNDSGLLILPDLIANFSGNLTPYGMNERDETGGFPQICGRTIGNVPIVLTPVSVPQ